MSQDAAIALRVVHRSVRCIDVYQCVQSFLNVHTGSQRERAAHDNANITMINLVEDFQLLLHAHAALHYDNLVFGNAGSNQFLPDVLIEVETGVLVLIVVSEDSNSTFVALCLLQALQRLTDGLVGLAVRIVVRRIACLILACLVSRHFSTVVEHKSHIDGSCLGNTVHGKRNVTVLLLLLTIHLIIFLQRGLHILHHGTEGLRLWQIDVLCLAAFKVRDLFFHAACLLCQDGIGNTAPDTHQLWQVHVTGKAVILLELTTGRKLQHLLQVAEVPHKVVEVVDAILLHRVGWHQIAHEGPNLCCRIADRCTGGKDNITTVVLFQHSLSLQIYALCLL